MGNYIVNKNGDNEVHNLDKNCSHLPDLANQIKLGYCIDDKSAVIKAKQKGYQNANGCHYCADSVDTG